MKVFFVIPFVLGVALIGLFTVGCDGDRAQNSEIPGAVLAIMSKPRYSEAIWGLMVLDLEADTLIYNLKPDFNFETGSIRKLFSVGLAFNELGADHRFITPVHLQGEVDEHGVLIGDVILVASGDLTLGGRRAPQNTIAFTNFDHNEAESLGSAILTTSDPLAGFDELAQQVAEAGIQRVEGDVIIDDRLFDPFDFRGQFDVKPIFVNDDLIDVTIFPTEPGQPAIVDWRPKTAAFEVPAHVMTVAAGEESTITREIAPDNPRVGMVTGQIPEDFIPPLTGQLPLVQTFRITDPSTFARTAFIEALERAGITVIATPIGPNPAEKLPPENSYTADTQVAELVSPPYSEYAKYILKVSYNIGADTSLVLFGLEKGLRNINDALEEERKTLMNEFGINGDEFHFVDGSGGPGSVASTGAVIELLQSMSKRGTFNPYFDSLPILGVDGSLAAVEVDSPARGQVFAKTGTTAFPAPTWPFTASAPIPGGGKALNSPLLRHYPPHQIYQTGGSFMPDIR